MLIHRVVPIYLIFSLSLAKSIIGTQSGWYFPPFADKPRKARDYQDQEQQNFISQTERIKGYASFKSNQLSHRTSMAVQVEQRLAQAVDMTRRTRMYFFYGLMLKSYNYMRDLRLESERMVKDIKRQVNELERIKRSRYKRYKTSTKMESIEKLLVKTDGLEGRLDNSVDEFNSILDDFMEEVYRRKAKKIDRFIQQRID